MGHSFSPNTRTPNPAFDPTDHGKPWSAAQRERWASMFFTMRHHSACCLVLAVAPAYAGSLSFDQSFSMSSGATYQVRLRQEVPAQRGSRSFKEFGYWGAEGAERSYCVSSFSVTRRKAAVRVPGKAFADLCNVSSLKLSERKGLLVLSLRGGDAADAFSAEFHFRGVYLVERIVRHGEFPEAFERTQYRYNTYAD